MDRHFLIAVSEKKSALFGVRFVGNFFSDKKDIKSTLFHSLAKPPAVWGKERNFEEDRRQKEQEKKAASIGEKALSDARKEFAGLGFPPDNIFSKLKKQEFSKVGEIIQEGEKGNYDAVVIGRRGLSMLEEAFEQSFSTDLFNESFTFPVWLCRSSGSNGKNVLLYLDGSQTSFRMTDHVGFILGLEKKHRVDILISDEKADANDTLKKSKKILLGHGLPEELIRHTLSSSDNIAKKILDAVDKEQYAAVALGRSGKEKNLFMRLFKGPVCSTLFKELQNAALWICY